MKPAAIGEDAWRYFKYAPECYPVCVTCGVGISRIREAAVVQVEPYDGMPTHPTGDTLICYACREACEVDDPSDMCTIEKLREITNAEERIRAREETFAKNRARAAKHFRSEKSKKAASTKAKRKSAKRESEPGSGGRDKPTRKQSGGSRRKKSRVTKVRQPKRKKVASVDHD